MKNWVLNRQASSEIRRTRSLPFPGRVLVELGQSVHPEDPIAEVDLPGKVFSLNIARGLGIEVDQVLSCLVRDLGEELAQGDVIAESEGAFPRLMRVPMGGRLLACHDGVAFIASGKNTLRVLSGMIGVVSDILPERGAVITTRGSLLQGLWGNGQLGAGILRINPGGLEKAINPDDFKDFDEGQVIAAARCSDETALKAVADCKPTGLVLGSLKLELMAEVLRLPFPVILLAGFGQHAPDALSSEILRKRNGDVVCINACQPDLLAGERPEVTIPNVSAKVSEPMPFRAELKIGQRVARLSGPAEEVGLTVVDLPGDEIDLESGLTCQAAVLHSDTGEKIVAPRSDLFILDGQNL